MAKATTTKKRTKPNSQSRKKGVTTKVKETVLTRPIDVAVGSIVNLYNIEKTAINGKVTGVHGGYAIDVVVVPSQGENYSLSSVPHIEDTDDPNVIFWD